MENTKNKEYELGVLPTGKDNRYWQIKLGKHRLIWLNIFTKNVVCVLVSFVEKIIGIVVFSILLIPICIIASIISFNTKGKTDVKEDRSDEIKNAIEVYKRFMDVYPVRVYSPLIKSLEVGLLKNYDIKPPSLEIAIGDGYLSSFVFEGKKDRLNLGSDMIYETILSVKKYSHFDKLAVFDVEEIPLPENCVNTVIMNNLIHHLPSRKKALSEVERVLKPGGLFIFTDNLYGWIEYTFDSRLLRFFHLGFIARKLEAFKLRLFAQKLLTSPEYWNHLGNSRMEAMINREFGSKKAMTISSIFEYLNFLQGQPTRASMKLLLKIGFLRRFIDREFENIIRYLIINDNKLLKDGQGAYLFVVLKKKEDHKYTENDLTYVCPKCKGKLLFSNNEFICRECNGKYITRKGIPIFLSYQEDLHAFKEYLEISDKKPTKEFIT